MNAHLLCQCFDDMPDPRCQHLCQHKLIDILMIALCASIAGSDTWIEIVEFAEDREAWLRQFLDLPNGIPSHDTFQRVFALMNRRAFEQRFRRWVTMVQKDMGRQVIAVDGKALRRARNAEDSPLYMVSAWASESRLVLGQTKVHEKSNEITAIPELLSSLDISGCIVTIDAIGCQRKIAQQIVDQKGDYLLAVKDNQPGLRSRMDRVLAGSTPISYPSEVQHAKTTDKGHGRIEIRHCWVIDNQDILNYVQEGRSRWASLGCLVKVGSTRVPSDTAPDPNLSCGDVRYYIASRSMTPEEALEAIRGHWTIENCLHWCLDMSFREDESRYRTGNGPENLATIRHIAMSMLKQDPNAKSGIRARRLRAARSVKYLQSILRW